MLESNRRKKTREVIIFETQKILSSKGYDKLTIRNIAKSVKCNPATIYIYFKNKDELLVEITQLGFKKLSERLFIQDLNSNCFSQFRFFCREYLAFANSNPSLYELMFISEITISSLQNQKLKPNHRNHFFDYLHTILVSYLDSGTIRTFVNTESLALSIWAFLHGLHMIRAKKRINALQPGSESKHIDIALKQFFDMIHK